MTDLVERERVRNREMILNPLRWPHVRLPLKRKNPFDPGNTAVFCPPLDIQVVPVNEPIVIYLCTLFDDLRKAETKTYPNIEALLDDGWIVD